MKAPLCDVCGRPKLRGTFTKGKVVREFWTCGALAGEHEEIMSHEGDVDWDDGDDMAWEDVDPEE
jgi:hypothetical protein